MDDSEYNIGSNFSVLEHELGVGAYGKVNITTMDNTKKIATKMCTNINNKKYGIPFLTEPVIMKSIIHPHINPALNTFSQDNTLYIFQELAKCDMRSYTRNSESKKGTAHYSTIPELKKWCRQLLSALACFHKESIIHADIKAANVLLFMDDNVKLSDFTLCRKKWFSNQKFTHTTGTPTHRSLECWLNLPWEKDLDIWALGCTFFEIAYGRSLFPMQKETEEEKKLETERKKEIMMKEKYEKDKNMEMVKETKNKIKNIERGVKKINKKKAINCILDWGEKFSQPLNFNNPEFEGTSCISKDPEKGTLKYPRYKVNYNTFELPNRFYEKEMEEFNSLIISMLEIDSSNRPKIETLLEHPFVNYEKVKAKIIRPVRHEFSKSDQARILRCIQCNTDEPSNNFSSDYPVLLEKCRELAFKIYSSCSHMNKHPENILVTCVCWIANKIVMGHPPLIILENKSYNIEEIIKLEEEICEELKFRLHLV